MIEDWKRYKDTQYAISNKGRVINLKTSQILSIGRKGCASLVINKEKKTLPVGRAVYELFVGEIPKGFLVYHKDDNYRNNELNNLLIETNRGWPKSAYCSSVKQVRCLETNHVYKSVKECSQSLDVCMYTLIRHLKLNKPNNIDDKHYVYETDYQESIS